MTDKELGKYHLSYDELACHDSDRTPYPLKWRDTRLPALAWTFESLRQWLGNKPLIIISGYRTEEYNRTVTRAAMDSQHVQGRALDIALPKGMDIAEFHKKANAWKESRVSPYLGGIGYYKSFIHIDVRPQHIATWGAYHGHRA